MAMGPKNACSYADLAMGIIDEKARFGGAIRPMLQWRYRDDIFDLWTHDVPKLLEFTAYINSLYPTIKFELVYSECNLNMLDLALHLQDGLIYTNIYMLSPQVVTYICLFQVRIPFIVTEPFPMG